MTTNKMAASGFQNVLILFFDSLVRVIQGERSYLFTDQVDSAAEQVLLSQT